MKDFLKKESQKWVDSEIITQEQLNEIYGLYPESKTNSLVVVFAIIGSLLIGTGIILIFASNWWKIPVFFRIVLSFVPLLLSMGIGIYCYHKEYLTMAFREGIGVFSMLSVFANVALIGQMFHSSSNVYNYIGVCLLLSLPSIYIWNSFAVFMAYMLGTITTTTSIIYGYETFGEFILPVALIVAIIPFIILTLRKEISKQKENTILTLSTLLAIAFLCSILMWRRGSNLSDYVVAISMILISLNDFYNYWKNKNERTPFKNFGVAMQSLVLILSTFDSYLFPGSDNAALLIIPAIIYLAPKVLTKKWFVPTDSITIATVLLLILESVSKLNMVITSVVIFLVGIYFMYVGSKQLTLRHLNYGLFLTFGIILVRFFSSDLNILLRGIIFIFLGIAFLAINIVFSKKRKELVE